MITAPRIISELAFAVPDQYRLVANAAGSVDITLDPRHALHDQQDFVRVADDDGTYRVLLFTHNEVLRGEVRLSGALTGMLSAVVRDMVAAL